MSIAYIGFGGNVGDVRVTFNKALTALQQCAKVTARSKLYISKAWGYTDQSDFLNAVVEIETELAPLELLASLQVIESDLGKTFIHENGPRAIDLDILFYEDRIIDTEELTIPHAGIASRDFVLLPLCDLKPDLLHPVMEKSMQNLEFSLRESYVTSVEDWVL